MTAQLSPLLAEQGQLALTSARLGGGSLLLGRFQGYLMDDLTGFRSRFFLRRGLERNKSTLSCLDDAECLVNSFSQRVFISFSGGS